MKRIITFTFILALLIVGYIKNNINTVYADDEYNHDGLRFTLISTGETSNPFIRVCKVSDNNDDAMKEIKLEYRIGDDGGEWTSLSFNDSISAASIIYATEVNKPIYIRCTESGVHHFSIDQYNYVGISCSDGSKFEVSGDITTLISPNGGITKLSDIEGGYSSYCFNKLFMDSKFYFDSDNIILPSVELTEGCFLKMFSNCPNIEKTPSLLTSKVPNHAYEEMFANCGKLASSSQLNATEVGDFGYKSMFSNCSSLVEAPEINAVTVGKNSFQNMFQQCVKLQTPPSVLKATNLISAENCYSAMFLGCEELVSAPAIKAEKLSNNCFGNMFRGCIKLSSAPNLLAEELAAGCYVGMFYGCTNLQHVQNILPATELADSCYSNMFAGCIKLETAPKLPATTLAKSCYEQMFASCVKLSVPPELPATNLSQADHCYDSMFVDCAELKTPPALPATTLAPYCYYQMFAATIGHKNGIETAPVLPATDLTGCDYCYSRMFGSMAQGGSQIKVAPALPATKLAPHCYEGMFISATLNGSAPSPFAGGNVLEIAPELPAIELADSCYAGMFAGCSNLKVAPELPALILPDACSNSSHPGDSGCYTMMFAKCISLKVPPELPAAALTAHCYQMMFAGCTGIGISDSQSGDYSIPYRIPSGNSDLISHVDSSISQMFFGCSIPNVNSPFNGTPEVSDGSATTLYLKGGSVTISFDANDDTTALNDQTTQLLGFITFPSVSKSGYILKGWSLRPDGKGKIYSSGEQVEARGNMKFYAIWEEISNPSSPSSGDSTNTSTRHIVPNTSVSK